jgi:hypothetical protein
MRKSNIELSNTTNGRIYKVYKANKQRADWCPHCPPYQGCNRVAGKGKPLFKQRNWKRFRKKQYYRK